MTDPRQKLVLEKFFKTFRDSLKNNSAHRAETNKLSVHYFTESLRDLRNQVALVGGKLETNFNAKYSKALDALAKTSLSDLTFGQVQKTLKSTFLEEFTALHKLGIEVGHVQGNLTGASKAKASTELFNRPMSLRANNIEEVSAEDLQNISKTLALVSAYTQALETLDKVSSRKDLIALLKKSGAFKLAAEDAGTLVSLEQIKTLVQKSLGTDSKGSGWASGIGIDLLSDSIITLEPTTTLSMTRTISANKDGIAVSFEVRALNGFKGNISNGIKDAFLKNLDLLLAGGSLPTHYNKSLINAMTSTLTKEEYLKVFPNVTSSKDIVTAVEDIVIESLKIGKVTPYKSSKTIPQATVVMPKIKIAIKAIKLPALKVKEKNIKARTTSGQFISPVSIKNLLNSKLAQQIQKNMGKGNAKAVLNYRTGRLANSAEVTNVTNRGGAITAFYNYMKNPYETFAPGGAQGSPASRDPNKLIATSIRQLATTIMQNRLKVVPV